MLIVALAGGVCVCVASPGRHNRKQKGKDWLAFGLCLTPPCADHAHVCPSFPTSGRCRTLCGSNLVLVSCVLFFAPRAPGGACVSSLVLPLLSSCLFRANWEQQAIGRGCKGGCRRDVKVGTDRSCPCTVADYSAFAVSFFSPCCRRGATS